MESNADGILAHGVDVFKGAPVSDFGRGFYTTTDENNAREWSERKARRYGNAPAIVKLTLNRLALGQMSSIAFVRGSLLAQEYWSFVTHCRSGYPQRPGSDDFYDVAYGPVAKVWFGNTNSAVWADYDQISFHTQAAQDMLNSVGVCEMERVS